MPQSRSRTATATADPPEVESGAPETQTGEGGPVIEMAEIRESLENRMTTLESSQTEVLEKLNEILKGRVEEDLTMGALVKTVTNLELQLGRMVEKPSMRDRMKDEVEDLGKGVRTWGRRSWRFVKRETTPRPPNRDHVKGLVVGNLCEYFALVGAAQLAPVAIGNAVTAALFL